MVEVDLDGAHDHGVRECLFARGLDGEPPVQRAGELGAHPPKGRAGGRPGAPGAVALKSGPRLRPKGYQVIPDGDRLLLHLPGGGGMGDPATRDPALVARDVRDGLVSVEAARRDYKVAIAGGTVDDVATRTLRG